MDKINVVIVDDHPMMRHALQFAIEAEADMRVAGQAADGLEALQVIAACRPDVVVLDLLMPQMDGLETMARLSTCQPAPKILVVSSVEEEATILHALRAGASGYLTKAAGRSDIVAAVRAVQAGEVYLPGPIAAKVMRAVRQSAADAAPPRERDALTQREQAVLALLGQGRSSQQIAAALNIAPATVRVHLYNIMSKLGFKHRHQLVAYAARQSPTLPQGIKPAGG